MKVIFLDIISYIVLKVCHHRWLRADLTVKEYHTIIVTCSEEFVIFASVFDLVKWYTKVFKGFVVIQKFGYLCKNPHEKEISGIVNIEEQILTKVGDIEKRANETFAECAICLWIVEITVVEEFIGESGRRVVAQN